MCDLLPAAPQPAEKMGKMKKLRRTLSESFRSIGKKICKTMFLLLLYYSTAY